jgi:hypothetical protein
VNTRRQRVVVALAVGATLVAAVQLVTAWAIHTDRAPLRDPLYLDKLSALRKRPAFAPESAGPKPFALLFVGSSRTLVAVDAGAVGPDLSGRVGHPVEAFNFGTAGAGPVTCAVYLRRLLADGVRPDAVVIEVLPPLLAAQINPPEARWLPSIRLRPDELPLVRRYGFPAERPAAHGCRGWLLPLHEYRMPLIDRYAAPMSLMPFPMGARQVADAYGFDRWREVTPEDRAKMLERTQRQYSEYLDGFEPGGCGVAAVRDALEACREANIPAALLLAPESSEFRGLYPEPGRSRLVPVLNELTRGTGAELFDTRDWVADELLGDGHHLTGTGARVFTARLTRDALAPWLAMLGAKGTTP